MDTYVARQPIFDINKQLPLDEDIKNTLVERKGPLAGYLFLAETYEKGQWPQMAKICRVMNIDEDKLPDLYLQACKWSNTFS